MKKLLPLILIIFLLAACTGQQAAPAVSDAEIATRVAKALTEMPTSSVPTLVVPQNAPQQPQQVATVLVVITATPEPPTVTPPPPTPTETVLAPTATVQPTQGPTATAGPSAVPTFTPVASLTAETTPQKGGGAPTATPVAGDPRTSLGNATWKDSMDSAKNWPVDTDKFLKVLFKNGYMTLTALTQEAGWRLPLTSAVSNGYIEGTFHTQACNGQDYYGLIFRIPESAKPDQGYIFGLTCDGRYMLKAWDGRAKPKGVMTTLLDYKASPAINKGANQNNRVGVMLSDKSISLYANGTLLQTLKDGTFGKGYFGVVINPDQTKNLVVDVDEVEYWAK
jgi:hypothetical protein